MDYFCLLTFKVIFNGFYDGKSPLNHHQLGGKIQDSQDSPFPPKGKMEAEEMWGVFSKGISSLEGKPPTPCSRLFMLVFAGVAGCLGKS